MEEYICGRMPVLEYLKSGKGVEKLYVERGEKKGSIIKIIGMAKEAGAVIVELDKGKLTQMTNGAHHQGVALLAMSFEYSDLDEILESAMDAGHPPFLVLLDEITDPHNLGAIIRTAECCGVDGILIPKRRSALVNATAIRTSAGASAYQKIAKVGNINTTIDLLKKKNIWIYGAEGKSDKDLWHTDFSGGVCLVIGSEGKGLSKLTADKCDFMVSIPMLGKIESLNASVSAGILMYEVLRGRQKGN